MILSNPAEFYVKQLAVTPGQDDACKLKVNSICDHYASTLGKAMKDLQAKHTTTFVAAENSSPYKTSMWVQYQALSWRSYVCTLREPILTTVRFLQAVVMAFFVGVFFYQTKYDQQGSFNSNGAIFLFLTALTLINSFAVVNIFCAEVPIFLREHNSGMYQVGPYFVMRNVAETPIFVLIPIFYGLVLYYLIGLNPPFDACLYLIVVGIFVSLVGVSYGYFFSTVCNDIDLALAFGPPLFMPLQLLGGYYINNQ